MALGNCDRIRDAIGSFAFEGKCVGYERYGCGHINDTFRIRQNKDGEERQYILQRMNHNVFKNPENLMKNIQGVTGFLREKIIERGGDPDRETLNLVDTREGKKYYIDRDGNYWRAYLFIGAATCYNLVERPEDFYQSGKAFGRFQSLLADYPAEELYETIPDFHNTPARFLTFKKILEEDPMGRAAGAQQEISFITERAGELGRAWSMLEQGVLPLRVTHNDTKLNNIMIDDATREAVCVIDLDTIMPGLSIFDFGDSIRFGANTAEEDERDLNKVSLSLPLFQLYTKGFLEGCQGRLTDQEISMLPMGAKLMTLECGMRFLTDFLQGDVYFKIHRENHNLDRCRTQFKLAADMEDKWSRMNSAVEECM